MKSLIVKFDEFANSEGLKKLQKKAKPYMTGAELTKTVKNKMKRMHEEGPKGQWMPMLMKGKKIKNG